MLIPQKNALQKSCQNNEIKQKMQSVKMISMCCLEKNLCGLMLDTTKAIGSAKSANFALQAL